MCGFIQKWSIVRPGSLSVGFGNFLSATSKLQNALKDANRGGQYSNELIVNTHPMKCQS